MKIIFLMMLIVYLTSACNLEFIQGLKTLNDKYCAETNAENRERIIGLIRKKKPDYPEHGLCGIEEKFMEQIA